MLANWHASHRWTTFPDSIHCRSTASQRWTGTSSSSTARRSAERTRIFVGQSPSLCRGTRRLRAWIAVLSFPSTAATRRALCGCGLAGAVGVDRLGSPPVRAGRTGAVLCSEAESNETLLDLVQLSALSLVFLRPCPPPNPSERLGPPLCLGALFAALRGPFASQACGDIGDYDVVVLAHLRHGLFGRMVGALKHCQFEAVSGDYLRMRAVNWCGPAGPLRPPSGRHGATATETPGVAGHHSGP
jgi:hypothetical protein